MAEIKQPFSGEAVSVESLLNTDAEWTNLQVDQNERERARKDSERRFEAITAIKRGITTRAEAEKAQADAVKDLAGAASVLKAMGKPGTFQQALQDDSPVWTADDDMPKDDADLNDTAKATPEHLEKLGESIDIIVNEMIAIDEWMQERGHSFPGLSEAGRDYTFCLGQLAGATQTLIGSQER